MSQRNQMWGRRSSGILSHWWVIPMLLVCGGIALGQPFDDQTQTETQRLEQERIVIKGNQGLPKTMFIAPWKNVRGEVPEGGPLESDQDRSLEPVDREVFQRQLDFYEKGYVIE